MKRNKTTMFAKALTAVFAAAAFTACGYDMADTDSATAGGDSVQVSVSLPGYYGGSPESAICGTRATENPNLTNSMLQPLDDNTTLWLVIYQEKSVAEGSASAGEGADPDTITFDTANPVVRSYKVSTVNDGSSVVTSLAPWTVDDEGLPLLNPGAPLYLKKECWYKFRVVSPARKLINNEALLVNNGQYLLATDDRYTQTMASLRYVKGSQTGIEAVKLNPIVNQTAQISFIIKAGANVQDIKAHHNPVIVSGLQEAVPTYSEKYGDAANWSLTDTLRMYLGHKRSSVSIDKEDFSPAEGTEIRGSAAVLPTNATSSPLVVMLNLVVNNDIVQKLISINRQVFLAGHSYNYIITLSVADGVIVTEWAVVVWQTDITLQ